MMRNIALGIDINGCLLRARRVSVVILLFTLSHSLLELQSARAEPREED